MTETSRISLLKQLFQYHDISSEPINKACDRRMYTTYMKNPVSTKTVVHLWFCLFHSFKKCYLWGLRLRSPSLLGAVAGTVAGRRREAGTVHRCGDGLRAGPVLSSGLRLRKSCRTQRGFTANGLAANGFTVTVVSGRRLYVTFDPGGQASRRRRRRDGLGVGSGWWSAWPQGQHSKYSTEVWHWTWLSTELYFAGNAPESNSCWLEEASSGRGASEGEAIGGRCSGVGALAGHGARRVWVALLSFTTCKNKTQSYYHRTLSSVSIDIST